MATRTIGVDDMVMLSKVSNDAINDNLKKRFASDLIYSYIGHVLISVNPYKEIKNLYTDRTLKDYRGKYRYELAPHVFSLADDMYRSLLSERENQCVIISGESGAGKTEAAKKIMQFVASITGGTPGAKQVKDVILESNPLLEAFGNAKTIRNNNSSRFGKYMEIQFNVAGDPIGGKINNYLLEKSRVVYQTKGERTFHVFYQLLRGADANMQQEFGLSGPEYFLYLSQSETYTVEGTDDRQEYNDTVQAMNVMGISPQDQMEIWRLLAAILYLGNVSFVNGAQDHAQIHDSQVVDMFAHLMQSDSQSCSKALCYRTITTGTQGKSGRSSTYACPQNADGAFYSRDALAKALYSRCFDWIVARVNDALGWKPDNNCLVMGILDIYGFEIFGKNGFEQFCINYVNERLQQIFIQLTLKAEQEEYAKEGIQWEHIDFFNNKICCDLIESKKPVGILAILDDTCNFPKGTDDKFLAKIAEAFSQHAHFQVALASGEFIIKHYAGDVTYNMDGFCDKNRDLLFNDLIELANATRSPFIPTLFPEASQAPDKRRPTSAGFKIKQSIQALVDALSKCTPHYIRCIKPNEKKRPGDYNNDLSLHQVKYLGLLENVRVRRAGYAYRQVYDKFFFRYRVCSASTWPNWNGGYDQAADAILQVIGLAQGTGYQKGNTKIFIRAPESVFALEELRERKVFGYANTIQRFFQTFSLGTYYYNIQLGGNQKLRGQKERRRNSLERPFKGDYIGYRENFPLKAMVEAHGKEKLHFGDRINKYDRRGNKQRRVFLLTDQAAYIMSVEKNVDKDKAKVAAKPWVYLEKRRIPLNTVRGFILSPMADNFICMQAPEYDTFFECRRKTELISTFLKVWPQVSITFSPQIQVVEKGGKSKHSFTFQMDPKGGNGICKGSKVIVAQGLPKDTQPNLTPPASGASFTVTTDPYGGLRSGNQGGGGAGRGGGGAGRAPPQPSYDSGGGSGGEQAKALYEFNAENPDELTFPVGAIIDVISKDGDWWRGSYNGAEGIFPGNYVQAMPRSAAPPARRGPPQARGPGPAPAAARGPPGRGAPMAAPSRGPAPGRAAAPMGMPSPQRGPPGAGRAMPMPGGPGRAPPGRRF